MIKCSSRLMFLPIVLATVITLPFTASAQTGTADSRAETPVATVPDAGGAPATVATSTPSDSTPKDPAPVTPAPSATPAAPAEEPSAETLSAEEVVTPVGSTANNLMLWAALAAFAVLPFGYLAAQALKKKPQSEEHNDAGCFNLKKLLEDKLRELTDLRGQLEGKIKDKAKEEIRESVKGTPAGEVLAFVEKAEKEYARLKKLYEECTIEFEKRAFKGTIVEGSLKNKDILEKIKIEKTRRTEDWVLHDVYIDEKKIAELSAYLTDGPWYAHFWKQDNDDMRIVFQDRVFTVKLSDKSTWADAITYGKSIGIPEEQLDFTRN